MLWRRSCLKDVEGQSEEWLAGQYSAELQRKGKVQPFDRARPLNRVRRKALQEGLITFHLAAAFDIYGLTIGTVTVPASRGFGIIRASTEERSIRPRDNRYRKEVFLDADYR